jgi:multimeric flavodoxin WrbA
MQECKKVFVLFGSPHNNGTTAKLLNEFLKAFNKTRYNIRIANVYEENILPCNDCGGCKKTFGCIIKQNSELFYNLEQADYIIIATPLYLLSMPAPLKAVFDRFQQYYNAKFHLGYKEAIKKPKSAFLIITSGNVKTDDAKILKTQIKLAFSVMNIKIKDSLVLDGTDNLNEEKMQQTLVDAKIKSTEFITEE